jgi:RimJ/RimL family protein N-acetyltransferase
MASNPHQTFIDFSAKVSSTFKSKRLVYRSIEDNEEDRKFIHEELDLDPVNQALTDTRPFAPMTSKTSQENIKHICENGLLAVLVCLPAPVSGDTEKQNAKPIPIGFVFLTKASVPRRKSEVGISMSKNYTGKGYGAEALDWTLDWAFRFGNLHKVDLHVFEYNSVARAVYERAGFVLEGRKRDDIWFDRRWWDTYVYGILESEWAAKRSLTEA